MMVSIFANLFCRSLQICDLMTMLSTSHQQDRVKPQLTELLLGFYDVIPESLLTIFDFHQLELLMW